MSAAVETINVHIPLDLEVVHTLSGLNMYLEDHHQTNVHYLTEKFLRDEYVNPDLVVKLKEFFSIEGKHEIAPELADLVIFKYTEAGYHGEM